jgi:hypothetical protein
MSASPFEYSQTAYLIDDRLYTVIPYPEQPTQAAQRLSKAWAFKTKPQSGVLFPRVAAGYAFEQTNPDIGSSQYVDWSDAQIAKLLPLVPALKLYAVASHSPGHVHPLPEPLVEILEKPAGERSLHHAESFTLREFLEIQREQDSSIGLLYGIRMDRASFRFVHGDNLLAASSLAKAQELRYAPEVAAAAMVHEDLMEAEQAPKMPF